MSKRQRAKSEKHPSKGSKPEKSQGEKFYTEREVHNKEAYAAFIRWVVLSKKERKAAKEVATQTEFAKKWNLHIDTLTDWKKREDYVKLRGEAIQQKLAQDTPDVMQALYKRIMKYGMGLDVELWLAYVEGWDKKKVLEMQPPLGFGHDDIRAMVERLPKDKQKTFYDNLTKLLVEAEAAGLADVSGQGN